MQTDRRSGGKVGEAVLPKNGTRLAHGCGVLSIALSLLAFGDYLFGARLQSLLAQGPVHMRPSTALALVLLGAVLLLLRPAGGPVRHKPVALLCCALAGAIGVASLVQLGLRADQGRAALVADGSLFGLMSPITAGALVWLSLALANTCSGLRPTRLHHALLALTALFALMPLLGYLYRAPFFYHGGLPGAVAPLTALGLVSLLAGCLVAREDEGLWPLLVGTTSGSQLARRALPAVLILPVLFGWLRLQAERYAQLPSELGAGLMTSMTVVCFVALALWAASRLRAQDLERRVAVAGLQLARNTLEARVEERTRVLTQTEVELRRAAAQLLIAKEAAEAATRARADFLARMSHEMRTPLNGVVGMLEIALRSELAPAQRDYVLTARSSAEALLSLINDILDFSKIDAGKLSLSASPFRLRDCIGTALRESAHAAHQKGLELFMSTASDVPDCVVGDPQRIRQVVSNLVSNAVKFTAQGEISVDVAADRRSHARVLLSLTVSDTGVGIPDEKQQAIFEAFAQADESTTRRFGGTGLGLAVSAQLVQLMGGKLGVESAEGQGARFFFTVELAVDEESELARTAGPGLFLQRRALLVEPHPVHRRQLAEQLQLTGLEVVTCPAHEALELLQRGEQKGEPFALLIAADDALGECPELLPALRQQLGDSWPVVLLTPATAPDPARHERLLLASAQLTKPVVCSDLLETIEGLLTETKLEPTQLVPASSEAPLNVLLAEDNEVNRRVACFLLEDAGYNVVAVENGREALAALWERPFDVVLMDGHMPEMDGIEATRQIRAREQGRGTRTPIVALTAQAMKGDRERYLAAGMDAYLTKPFHAAQLLATLREVVGRSPPESARPARANRRFRTGSRPSVPSTRPSAPARAPLPSARPLALLVPPPPPTQLKARTPVPPVYQREHLLSRLRGQERVLRTMVGIFDEEAPEMLDALSAKVDGADAAAVEVTAHKLAGALLTVGAERAAATARALEAAGRARELAVAPGLRDTLRGELTELRQAFVRAGDLPDETRSAL